MASLTDARERLKEYEAQHPYPESQKLEVSGLYSFLPAGADDAEQVAVGRLRNGEAYPNWDRAGVYLFLDRSMQVLYVGKTDLFAKRFDQHVHGKDVPRWQGLWTVEPSYGVTVAVPAGTPTEEVFCLERFLIASLRPPNNQLIPSKE